MNCNGKLFVKVCGITEKRQVEWAIELGYSAIGMVLHMKSPRYVTANKARELAEYAGKGIKTVAVALRFHELEMVAPCVDYIQLYEYINRDNLIYAGHTFTEAEHAANIRYLLYDTSRGSGTGGQFPEWLIAYKKRLILSGGLFPGNVNFIIRKNPCAGLDVSSGVEETRGVKDYALMQRFINEVRHEEC